MHSLWRTLDRLMLRDIALVCLAVGVIGLSYGAIAVASGFPVWFPVVLGLLVVAASSEFLFIGIIAAGGSPVAAVLAGLLVNARHLPFGLAVPDVLGRGAWRFLGTHLMNDETVVFALAQKDTARGRAAYWACGLGIMVCWPAGAAIGGLAGTVIHDTRAFGLDAMFPAILLALILPALRGDRDKRRAALAGSALALAAVPFLPAGLPVLLALAGLPLTTARKKAVR
ncbi:AzlC family ABC transporter permease [Streptomyces chattanoogensis]|uniref:AzlC family ABC transporter permease n=1 Tax=Streptomyces chattanoogensis TaxID=66876 RepID=UPI0036B48EA0